MDTPDYNLIIRTPVHQLASKTGTPTPIPGGNVTERVKDTWKRSKSWYYGDDIGMFTLYGNVDELFSFYKTWLTMDVVEISGGITTWNGMIIKMTLNYGLIPMTIDYTQMYNKVRATYFDRRTSYATNDTSIQMYGIRTKYLFTGDTSLEIAEDERDKFLEDNAFPGEYPSVSGKYEAIPSLDVYVSGYGGTLNNLYTNDSYDSGLDFDSTISEAMEYIIDDSINVNLRSVVSNTHLVGGGLFDVPAREYLDDLIERTNAGNSRFRARITSDREFYYRTFDNTPNYFVRHGNVFGSEGSNVAINLRMLEPGIYRNLDFVVGGKHRDSWFADRRDLFVKNVMIGSSGEAKFSPSSETMTNHFVSDIIREKEAIRKGKWHWKDMTDAQRDWWSGGRIGKAPTG